MDPSSQESNDELSTSSILNLYGNSCTQIKTDNYANSYFITWCKTLLIENDVEFPSPVDIVLHISFDKFVLFV